MLCIKRLALFIPSLPVLSSMSELKQSDGALDLPIIKVHVMMPGASSSRESTYASIKYSKTTTAEEVINHIRKKKVQFLRMLHSAHLLTFFSNCQRISVLNSHIFPTQISPQAPFKTRASCFMAPRLSATSFSRCVFNVLNQMFPALTIFL